MAVSVLIVRVAEAEPLVARLRERYDPAAQRGLGAHITLLHPFADPERLDAALLREIASLASARAAFSYQLVHLARFPGTLYLAPEPAAPFVALRAALQAAFPPFGPPTGRSSTYVPHLSIVRGSDGEDHEVEEGLRAILKAHGPIECRCRELVLIENTSGTWRTVREFALAA